MDTKTRDAFIRLHKLIQEQEKRIVALEASKPKRFVKPTSSELQDYFISKGATVQAAHKFWCYYESNGWKVGRNKMDKWKGAATGWIYRNGDGFKESERENKKQVEAQKGKLFNK